MNLSDLITRLETAPGNDRALFEEAFAVCFPVSMCWDADEGEAHYRREKRYTALLIAEAWESAVRLLLPEGFRYSVGTWDGYPHAASACVSEPSSMAPHFYGDAHTPENAFAAACLRTKEQSNG